MKIVSLHIYPIKGCRAIDLKEIEVLEAGPAHDRQWMLVDETGKFMSQRTHPQMAVIRPQLQGEKLFIEVAGQTFEVNAGADSAGPLEKYESVQVWSAEVQAQVSNNQELAKALNEHMKQSVRLVRFGDQSRREAKKSGLSYGVQTRFTDRTPFLLTTLGSLKDLNSRLENEIPMSRFRPNIVLDESMAWVEDAWESGMVGSLKMEITQGCGRCNVINIDQETGLSPSKEVLAKLAQFRKKGTNVYFGVMGIHRSLGKIKVGDSVQF